MKVKIPAFVRRGEEFAPTHSLPESELRELVHMLEVKQESAQLRAKISRAAKRLGIDPAEANLVVMYWGIAQAHSIAVGEAPACSSLERRRLENLAKAIGELMPTAKP